MFGQSKTSHPWCNDAIYPLRPRCHRGRQRLEQQIYVKLEIYLITQQSTLSFFLFNIRLPAPYTMMTGEKTITNVSKYLLFARVVERPANALKEITVRASHDQSERRADSRRNFFSVVHGFLAVKWNVPFSPRETQRPFNQRTSSKSERSLRFTLEMLSY